ncbi:MAG: glutaredoxin family protein [Thermoplasmata archaeon]
MNSIKRIHIVFAHWCPHCYPLTVEAFQRFSEEHGIPLNLLDIDEPEQERQADELVRAFGDWVDDYLIPQIFFEFEDGTIQHGFTGYSEGVAITAERLDALLRSSWLEELTPRAVR